MAIKITEDGNVIYENEPTVERELLPNITDGEQYAKQAEEALERIEEIAESIPEDYTQLLQDVATLEDSVSDLEEDVEELQNNYTPLAEDVTGLKNDLTNDEIGLQNIQSDVLAQGNITGTTIASAANRVSVNYMVPVSKGVIIAFTQGTLFDEIYIRKFDAAKQSAGVVSWSNKSLEVDWNGYVNIIFRNSSGSNITPSDYDAELSIITNWHNLHQQDKKELLSTINGLAYSVTNGGFASVQFSVVLYKDIEYTFQNLGTAACSVSLVYDDDATETISNSVAANKTVEFIPQKQVKKISGYFNSNATFTVTSKGFAERMLTLERGFDDVPYRRYAFMAFHKFGVIGDSLSVGYTANPLTSEASPRNIMYSWPQYLARMSGNIALNFGFSGLTTKTWLSSQYGYTRFIAEENLCQGYIVGLGLNDSSADASKHIDVGTIADVGTTADTFYRYYSDILTLINDTAPNAKIFVLTMPYFAGDADANYNNAIRTLAEDSRFDNVYLVDLEANYNNYYKSDRINGERAAGHYSCIGYANISSIMAKALSDVMNNNPTEFISIPFLPYGSNDVLD